MPMNTPPIKIAIGSKSLLLHKATNNAASISPCHISMRSIVLRRGHFHCDSAEKNLTHRINLTNAPANASNVNAISNHGDVRKYSSGKYPITKPPMMVPGSSNATPKYNPALRRKGDDFFPTIGAAPNFSHWARFLA